MHTIMQISTTTVPIYAKMSDTLCCKQRDSNNLPNILCVYYM